MKLFRKKCVSNYVKRTGFLQKYRDLFQQLVNAMDDEDLEPTADDAIAHEEIRKHSAKHVSKMEVLAQSFILLIAGYETTGTTLHFALYYLAKLPEIQRKAQEEIEQVAGDSVGIRCKLA